MNQLKVMSDPFWFWKTSTLNKILFIMIILILNLIIGSCLEADISKKAKLLKQELLSICSTDKNCHNVVQVNFQKCFDSSYDENGLGHYQRFDEEEFSECMNKVAGNEYFRPIRLMSL